MRLPFLLLFFATIIFAQDHGQIRLANEYYQQGEIDKSLTLFRDLAKSPSNFQLIASNYLAALSAGSLTKEAEQFLQKAIKNFPSNFQYHASLLSLYNSQMKVNEIDNFRSRFFKQYQNNPHQISMLAQFLSSERMYKESILYYTEARNVRNSRSQYSLELASLYRLTGQKKEMINEYLVYATSPNRLNYVKNLLQNVLQEDEDLSILEEALITKAQEQPDNTVFGELLIWLELQRRNFYGAFIQAKAIDLRNQSSGKRSYDIGLIALDNKAYDDAGDIFAYIAKKYANSSTYSLAKKQLVKSRELKVKNTYPIEELELRKLATEYHQLYLELGTNQIAFEALRSKALLHAFYLDEIDSGEYYLSKVIAEARANREILSLAKLDLGDLYLLKDEPWESTLLYSQVEKANKGRPISYDAKLRNARLNYFNGNFTLAKGHLDILKKNTTREISNDAISLGILIMDNTGFDSTEVVMQDFSEVELLVFQNKKEEAKDALIKMTEEYSKHSVIDEVYWLLGKLELEEGNAISAIAYMDKILAEYAYDILADDAAFKKAEIYDLHLKDSDKARSLYQQFIVEYQGSLYAAEARKRFRELRGDLFN